MSAVWVVFWYAILNFATWGVVRAAAMVRHQEKDKVGWLTWTVERALGTFATFMPLMIVFAWLGR